MLIDIKCFMSWAADGHKDGQTELLLCELEAFVITGQSEGESSERKLVMSLKD